MSLRFNGDGAHLSRTTNLPSITSWTMMGWFKISVDTNTNSLFWQFGHATNDEDYEVVTDIDGTTLRAYNGITSTNGSLLTVGTWYHLASTVSGIGPDEYLVYLNGVLDITMAGSAANTAEKLFVGSLAAAVIPLNGSAAAIKFYNAVLTPAEILNEMQFFVPVRTANLNTWLHCVDPASANFGKDVSGNGFDMTVNGVPTFEDGPPISWKPIRRKRPLFFTAPRRWLFGATH